VSKAVFARKGEARPSDALGVAGKRGKSFSSLISRDLGQSLRTYAIASGSTYTELLKEGLSLGVDTAFRGEDQIFKPKTSTPTEAASFVISGSLSDRVRRAVFETKRTQRSMLEQGLRLLLSRLKKDYPLQPKALAALTFASEMTYLARAKTQARGRNDSVRILAIEAEIEALQQNFG
jgi:hypothetical protein